MGKLYILNKSIIQIAVSDLYDTEVYRVTQEVKENYVVRCYKQSPVR